MPKLIILVGPPGSGKSTKAKELESQGFTRINQDSQGKLAHWYLFEQAFHEGKDMVVDRMNFNSSQRNRYMDPCKQAGYTIEIQVFHESYETCFNRCIQRKDHETIKTADDAKKALDFFFKNYERVDIQEADMTYRWYPEGYKPDAIICDLDGTLCNIDHRLHWVKGEGKKNWPMFFAGIKDDKINDWCLSIISFTNRSVILCSGRGSEYRTQTEAWLKGKFNHYHDLFMRMEGDYRPDHVVKEIILDFEILTRYTPYFAIDDRTQIVEMWRRRGITTLQCAKGDF